MKLEASVLDYLGKLGDGVLALISFTYEGKYYEGTFYYTSDQIMLNVDDDLEEVLGCGIKEYSEYEDILRFLIRNVVPWSEMINRIKTPKEATAYRYGQWAGNPKRVSYYWKETSFGVESAG